MILRFISLSFMITAFHGNYESLADSQSPIGQKYSQDALIEYYRKTGVGIQPNPLLEMNLRLNEANSIVKLEVNEGRLQMIPLNPSNKWNFQNLFDIQVLHFNKLNDNNNFLDAKFHYYQKLNFDAHHQVYTRQYGTLNSWEELIHPPIKSLTLPENNYTRIFNEKNRISKTPHHPFFSPKFQSEIDQLSATELSFGNTLKILPNGTSWQEKLRMIRAAKTSLWIAVMIMRCDASTEILIQEIIRRHREGIDVRIVLEGLYPGLGLDKGCTKKLEAHGVPVIRSSYYANRNQPQSLGVMHHKLWIMDDQEVILGGENLLNLNNYSDGFNGMRDTDVWVQGPSVTDARYGFIQLWRWVEDIDIKSEYLARNVNLQDSISLIDSPDFVIWDREKYEKAPSLNPVEEQVLKQKWFERERGVRGQHLYSEKLSSVSSRMRGVCRLMMQIPLPWKEINNSITPIYTKFVENSQDSIVLSIPDASFKITGNEYQDIFFQRLIDAANKKGIPIEFIANGYSGSGSEFTLLMEQAHLHLQKQIYMGKKKTLAKNFLELLISRQKRKYSKENRKILRDLSSHAPRIRTWTYFQYMHAKQALFDMLATAIGSTNLDSFSSYSNYESAILCMDESLRDQMITQMTLDLVNSIPTVSANGQ